MSDNKLHPYIYFVHEKRTDNVEVNKVYIANGRQSGSIIHLKLIGEQNPQTQVIQFQESVAVLDLLKQN